MRDLFSPDAVPSLNRLARDTSARFGLVAPFFPAGDPADAEAWRRAAERARAVERPHRAELVAALLAQAERFGAPAEAREAIRALGLPTTTAVVTGQQVSLHTGPLYTLYKALSAIHAAQERSAREPGARVVAVFWLEGEDHDFAEAASVGLISGDAYRRLRYDGEPTGGSVGPQVLAAEPLARLDERTAAALAPAPFRDAWLDALREGYAPGATFAEAFARLLYRMLPDTELILLDPSDPAIKRIAAPTFAAELAATGELAFELYDRDAALRRAGYAPQARARTLNLFLTTPRGRLTLEPVGPSGTVLVGADGETTTFDKLNRLLTEAPERFSPNVLLRPLMQDQLLPTEAYIGGPGELAYWAQLAPLYDARNLPMPLVVPRAGFTLIEPRLRKLMDRFGLELPDLFTGRTTLLRRLVPRVDRSTTVMLGALTDGDEALTAAWAAIESAMDAVDPTLGRAAAALGRQAHFQLGKLRDKGWRAQLRKHGELTAQLDRLLAHLAPDGQLQERAASPVGFLAAHGPALVGQIADALVFPPDGAHRLIEL